MRCLFCGKELAFLKRLTGGAEFCSDAHRKKYQEQFNDLALNRLLQSHPNRAPQSTSPELNTPASEPQVSPMADETPDMAGFLAELPEPYSPGPAKVEGGEPSMLDPSPLAMPVHAFRPGEQAREYSLAWAGPVVWTWMNEFRPMPVNPRRSGVEPREFSFETMRPVLQLAAGHRVVQSEWSPAPVWEALPKATNQPRPPSDSPELWYAAPRPFALRLEDDWLRLDFDMIQLAKAADSQPPTAQQEPPQPHSEPLPVILRGVSPGIARSVAVTCPARPAPIPDSLDSPPLRPAIVLKPKPVELSSAAAVTERSAKQRRPEVRIVPVTPEAPAGALPPPQASAMTAPPIPSTLPPAAKPALQPIPPAEPVKLQTPSLAPPSPASQLGLPELRAIEDKGIWSRMPMAAKLAVALVIAASIGGFAYMTFTSSTATAKTSIAQTGSRWETGSQINTNGWIEDWAPADPLRRVTLMRGTENLSNYRLAFTAQIQNKAIGWMFRGLNPKNYYVAKIEKLAPGPEQVVAFVRYAVIDGRNEGRIEKILPMKVHLGTPYKIRFDATGSHFAVWVLGEKVDEWEDARLGSGGLGLYSESDEAPAIQGGVNAWELVGTSVAGK